MDAYTGDDFSCDVAAHAPAAGPKPPRFRSTASASPEETGLSREETEAWLAEVRELRRSDAD